MRRAARPVLYLGIVAVVARAQQGPRPLHRQPAVRLPRLVPVRLGARLHRACSALAAYGARPARPAPHRPPGARSPRSPRPAAGALGHLGRAAARRRRAAAPVRRVRLGHPAGAVVPRLRGAGHRRRGTGRGPRPRARGQRHGQRVGAAPGDRAQRRAPGPAGRGHAGRRRSSRRVAAISRSSTWLAREQRRRSSCSTARPRPPRRSSRRWPRCTRTGTRVRTLSLFYEEWLGMLPVSELERVSLLFDIGELHRGRYGRLKRIIDFVIALGRAAGPAARHRRSWSIGNLVGQPRPRSSTRRTASARTASVFRDLQVPHACAPRRRRRAHRVDRRERSPHHPVRSAAARHPPRRAAAAAQHPQGRPRRGRPAARAAALRRASCAEKLPFYDVRHLVRPGLTGWAQVKYGYAGDESDALEKLQYEFYYLRHQSPRRSTSASSAAPSAACSAGRADEPRPNRFADRLGDHPDARRARLHRRVPRRLRRAGPIRPTCSTSSWSTEVRPTAVRRRGRGHRRRPSRGCAWSTTRSAWPPPRSTSGSPTAKGDVLRLLSAHGVPDRDYVATSVAPPARDRCGRRGGPLPPRRDRPGLAGDRAGHGLAVRDGLAAPLVHRAGRGRHDQPPDVPQQPMVDAGALRRVACCATRTTSSTTACGPWWPARLRPRSRPIYRPRSSLRALGRQFCRYGRWKATVMRRHPGSVQPAPPRTRPRPSPAPRC